MTNASAPAICQICLDRSSWSAFVSRLSKARRTTVSVGAGVCWVPAAGLPVAVPKPVVAVLGTVAVLGPVAEPGLVVAVLGLVVPAAGLPVAEPRLVVAGL